MQLGWSVMVVPTGEGTMMVVTEYSHPEMFLECESGVVTWIGVITMLGLSDPVEHELN